MTDQARLHIVWGVVTAVFIVCGFAALIAVNFRMRDESIARIKAGYVQTMLPYGNTRVWTKAQPHEQEVKP